MRNKNKKFCIYISYEQMLISYKKCFYYKTCLPYIYLLKLQNFYLKHSLKKVLLSNFCGFRHFFPFSLNTDKM